MSIIGTIVIVQVINGEYNILTCIRGDGLSGAGTIFTQGGSINPGEDPLIGTLREAREEASISPIDPSTVELININTDRKTGNIYYNYVVIVDSSFSASGPEYKYRKECKETSEICGVPTFKKKYTEDGRTRRYIAWVPYSKIEQAGQTGAGTRTIKNAIRFLERTSTLSFCSIHLALLILTGISSKSLSLTSLRY